MVRGSLLCYSDLCIEMLEMKMQMITYTLPSFHQETIQLTASNPLTFHLG